MERDACGIGRNVGTCGFCEGRGECRCEVLPVDQLRSGDVLPSPYQPGMDRTVVSVDVDDDSYVVRDHQGRESVETLRNGYTYYSINLVGIRRERREERERQEAARLERVEELRKRACAVGWCDESVSEGGHWRWCDAHAETYESSDARIERLCRSLDELQESVHDLAAYALLPYLRAINRIELAREVVDVSLAANAGDGRIRGAGDGLHGSMDLYGSSVVASSGSSVDVDATTEDQDAARSLVRERTAAAVACVRALRRRKLGVQMIDAGILHDIEAIAVYTEVDRGESR